MKKKITFILSLPIFILLFFLSCKSKTTEKNKSEQKVVSDSSQTIKLSFVDSLKMIPGEIPEGWKKINLDKGYYIAFPRKPWKKIIKEKRRVEFHYPQKNFDTYVSLTDLEKEPAFNNNKNKKERFFDALIKDLVEELKETDAHKQAPEIVKKEYFLFQNIYEGVRVEFESFDVHIFIQCVLLGKTLYTMAVLIWDGETPSVLQAKDRFFNSFSKELQIK